MALPPPPPITENLWDEAHTLITTLRAQVLRLQTPQEETQ